MNSIIQVSITGDSSQYNYSQFNYSQFQDYKQQLICCKNSILRHNNVFIPLFVMFSFFTFSHFEYSSVQTLLIFCQTKFISSFCEISIFAYLLFFFIISPSFFFCITHNLFLSISDYSQFLFIICIFIYNFICSYILIYLFFF